jgi:hypothetical protein
MATERDPSAKGGIANRLKQDSKQKIETGKRSAADQIDQVAQALSRAGEELNQSQPTLANYAGQIASSVSTLATRLRDGSIDDIVTDTRELARRNPGLFLLGGVALGVALSRFLKASADQTASQEYSGDYAGEQADGYSESGDYTGIPGRSATGHETLEVESGTYAGLRSADDFSTSRPNGG